MQPEDVGDVVYHLLSDTGMCLDGQNIMVRKQLNFISVEEASKQTT